ncbi:MAG: hypothetical protein M9913_05735 [Bryobacteraceae bacterium]|nr:hypothetical protein [Solibacteraceae bacterium]MCO5350391.1 hypothetical protein [Bryobacteraceae bacterium]
MKPLLMLTAALGLMALAPPPRLGDPLPGRDGAPGKAFEEVVVVESDGRQILVDAAGVVRRVFAAGAPVRQETQIWLEGRALWRDVCARCHGIDGRDTGYPGTRSMQGYGNGKTDEQILRRIETSSTVDVSVYSARDRRALAMFVGGL